MPAIDVSLENTYKTSMQHPTCQSRVCESRVEGIDCGSEVSEWLSLALGKPNLRLIRQNQRRQKKGTRERYLMYILFCKDEEMRNESDRLAVRKLEFDFQP